MKSVKDHDDNPLHVLAAKNATTMLNDIGKHMSDIWNNNINEKELLKRVDLQNSGDSLHN